MKASVHKYSFSDLTLRPDRLARILGYPEGNCPDPIPEIMREIMNEIPDHADIRGGYSVFENVEFQNGNRILVNDLMFNTGKIITRSLWKSEKIAFFMLTAGSGIEVWSREMIRKGDSISGYIIDLLGSEVVEAATETMLAGLDKEMLDEGLSISNPYNPGYCDWPTADQQKLFKLFPEQFCGISLTRSSLMVPVKSLSGIIGIGRDVKKMPYNCQICDIENCPYREYREEMVI